MDEICKEWTIINGKKLWSRDYFCCFHNRGELELELGIHIQTTLSHNWYDVSSTYFCMDFNVKWRKFNVKCMNGVEIAWIKCKFLYGVFHQHNKHWTYFDSLFTIRYVYNRINWALCNNWRQFGRIILIYTEINVELNTWHTHNDNAMGLIGARDEMKTMGQGILVSIVRYDMPIRLNINQIFL